METKDRKTTVLMLPWLAHGHVSPFLELAKNLTSRNFHIYFCSTPVILNSIRGKISQKHSLSIELVELHLPSLPELPSHYHTTRCLPPHLMPTLKKAFDMSSASFSNIIKILNPNILIYDFLQPWAPAVASSQNIPAVEFLSTSATMSAFVMHHLKNPGAKFPFPSIFLYDHEAPNFNRLIQSSSSDVGDKLRFQDCHERSLNIILIKTFREIEAKYIDHLSNTTGKKFVPVGPLVPGCFNDDEEGKEITKWLENKETLSTVFVSFGTEFFLSKDEIEEIAYGLELARVNFIWVLSFPQGKKTSLEGMLPKGYLSRVGERGMLMEGWAPQIRILGHPSVGGFVSHCGWGSVMESMKHGVPIVAMPMHLDQPLNARLVEEVGVGVEVKRDKSGSLQREEVAKAINAVLEMGKSADSVRKKAEEFSEIIRKKGDEEMDGVVEVLVQLCTKSNQ